jgi:glycosyltransferase involved in cell wall biosynthesis
MEQFDHTIRSGLALQRGEIDRWGVGLDSAALPEEMEVEEARAREEIAIRKADLVIAASDYTRRAMAHDGYETEKVKIVPYGIDLHCWSPGGSLIERLPGPLRVLFVASVDLRKGILYLLQAIRHLSTKNIEFRAAGSIDLDTGLLSSYVDRSCFLGPIPRTQVQELFHWADIFVFPTLGEGFGMVQVEAIATGTPVIATTECGEVVREGIEGHIVPPRDPDAIAHWLDYYATDPSRLQPLRTAALERARFFSIDAYVASLLDAVKELA